MECWQGIGDKNGSLNFFTGCFVLMHSIMVEDFMFQLKSLRFWRWWFVRQIDWIKDWSKWNHAWKFENIKKHELRDECNSVQFDGFLQIPVENVIAPLVKKSMQNLQIIPGPSINVLPLVPNTPQEREWFSP